LSLALGIEEARAIASAPGAFRLAFGSGDYRRDTGTSVDNMAMAYPRSRLVVASRIGNLPGPDRRAYGWSKLIPCCANDLRLPSLWV
jgi:citrate lyase beta subunit